MLVSLIVCAPWLVGIAWVVHRHGLRVLLPRDDVPVSFGERARRRAVGS
jgi:hypothetical protein